MAFTFDETEFRRHLRLAEPTSLSDSQVALAAAHARLLLKWNAMAGLTTLVHAKDVACRHFVESLLVASLVPPSAGPVPGVRVLDVGSGGGFPGLALRIARPDAEVTLVEPRSKKAAFLRAAARLYPPPATHVVAERIEEVADDTPWPVTTLRAVRVPVRHLVRLTTPGGIVITLGGERPSELEDDLARAGFGAEASLEVPGRAGVISAWRRPT